MPTETKKPSRTRRAFLTGDYFTRSGRVQLASEYPGDPQTPLGAVSLDRASCLGWRRMACLGCKEVCPEKAISLVSNLQPRIDRQLCNDCGKCAVICPANAINIAMLGNH